MEQSRKNLKFMSIAMLILAGLSFARILLELIFTDFNAEAAEGVTKELWVAAVIIIAVIGFILLLPQIYIGIKGIKVSKNPDSSKGHIVWAVILLVISIIGLVAYVVEAIKTGTFKDNISAIINMLLDVTIYSSYLEYAKKVRANA